MSTTRWFVCCDNDDHVYEQELSDHTAESYDSEVNMGDDGFPDPDSFREWTDKYEIDTHACSDCGSDGALSGYKRD
ncbi:hypothetical protein [Serratia fonticola]